MMETDEKILAMRNELREKIIYPEKNIDKKTLEKELTSSIYHAQIVGGHLKAAAGAGGGLFKDQGNVFAPQLVVTDTGLLFGLQVSGQLQQLPDLGRGVVQ